MKQVHESKENFKEIVDEGHKHYEQNSGVASFAVFL